MPLSPIAELSQELVDEIVDNLAQLSPRPTPDRWGHRKPWADLNACALVCHSFRARAQVHIFRLIAVEDFRTHKRDPKILRLRDAVECNPVLVNHMRELELKNSERGFSWVLQDPHLLQILNLANRERQRFEKLVFRVMGTNFSASFRDLGSEIVKLVGTQITSLSLRFLDAQGYANPHILTHLPHLTELFLHNVSGHHFGASSPVSVHSSYPKLQVLDSYESLYFVAFLSSSKCSADLSQLRVVKATLELREEISRVQAMVNIAFKSLTVLELAFIYWPLGYYKNDLLEWAVTLDQCRSLRLLKVTVPFAHSELFAVFIIHTLKTIPDRNELREFHLFLEHSTLATQKHDVLQAPWAAVGDELKRIGADESFRFYTNYCEGRSPRRTWDWDEADEWEQLENLDETYLKFDEDCQEVVVAVRQKIEDQIGLGEFR